MSSVVIFRARQVMVAMCLLAAFLGNASAAPNTITVQGQTGSPVAEAIQELEKRYGWQITYEDPPYVHYSDITDVTGTFGPGVPVRSQSELQAMGNTRTLGPKGGSLTFTLPSADPEPVLDTLITIEPKERTFGALLEEVFKKVFIATNTRIVIGTVSANMLILSKTAIGGSGRTARSILEQWFLGGGGLSWELMNAPAHNVYVFSIIQPIPNKGLILLPRPSPAEKP